MPPLNQISKEEIEKIKNKSEVINNHLWYVNPEHIVASHLRLIEGMIERCKEYSNYVNSLGDERNKGKIIAMCDLIEHLQSEKETINKIIK